MWVWATQVKLESLLFAEGHSPGLYMEQESNGFKKTDWSCDFDFIHHLHSIF